MIKDERSHRKVSGDLYHAYFFMYVGCFILWIHFTQFDVLNKHPLTKKYSIRHTILRVNFIIFTYTNLNVGLTTIKRFIFFHLLCRIICSRTCCGIWLFQPTQPELIYHLVRTFQSLNLRQLTFKELWCLPGTSTHIIVRGNCC